MSPTLAVIGSTVVQALRFQNFRQQTRKAHNGSSQFNRGTSIVFPKIYVSSMEIFTQS